MVAVGIDYGRKRTGIAVFVQGAVIPSEPVKGGWDSILGRMTELSEMYGEFTVVIGLPLSALGKPTELSREVEELARRIRDTGYAVETVNEVRSSLEAVNLLGKKDRKGRVDSVAACEILKRYLHII